MDNRILVVGGGLAGIAAALRLADGGEAVTLAEARPRLGGAASSFNRGELTVDNGQHVFLRCCTAYQELLARLGVADQVTVQPKLDVLVLHPDGRQARITRTPGMPAPGQLGAALAKYRLLSPADRLRAVRGALALRTLDPADDTLDAQTLGGFLRAHGQNDATIEMLWSIIATATLNCGPDEASLQLAATVFRTGLLDQAAAGDIGHALVPLGQLHHTAALRALASAGVEVLLNTKVSEVRPAEGGLTATLTGRGLPVDVRTPEAVVLAVPPRIASTVAPDLVSPELHTRPIVNVHLIYDRTVFDASFAAAVDSPVQWIFDRTVSSGLALQRPGAQYLAITVSAADDIVDETSQVLTERFDAAIRALLPAARPAELIEAFVTRERHATFDQRAGSGALRVGPTTEIPGLYRAGAWTATGWPDTMESAVRSGTAAAHSVKQRPAIRLTEFA